MIVYLSRKGLTSACWPSGCKSRYKSPSFLKPMRVPSLETRDRKSSRFGDMITSAKMMPVLLRDMFHGQLELDQPMLSFLKCMLASHWHLALILALAVE